MRWFVLLVMLVLAAPAAAQSPAAETEHKQPQILRHKPSGFWTSPHDASDRPYRWGKMAIGGVILAGMGLITWRLVKRANAERAARGR
jgi:hypothetical protein